VCARARKVCVPTGLWSIIQSIQLTLEWNFKIIIYQGNFLIVYEVALTFVHQLRSHIWYFFTKLVQRIDPANNIQLKLESHKNNSMLSTYTSLEWKKQQDTQKIYTLTPVIVIHQWIPAWRIHTWWQPSCAMKQLTAITSDITCHQLTLPWLAYVIDNMPS
jgi:hypothetical protein